MSTLIFILAGFILGIIILSKVPGIEHVVKPIIGLLFTGVEAGLTNLWAWGIYIIKTMLFSHLDFLKHLLMSAEQIDPTNGLREKYEK